jgi:hypothetical protein
MTSQISPTPFAPLVGSAGSANVLNANPSRLGLYVFNASAVTIWISPVPVVAAVNGAGSISLATLTGIVLGDGQQPGPFKAGLNAIAASGSNNPLTIWEYHP